MPAQVPVVHTSFCVQAIPSLHAVPSARGDQPVVEVAGVHAWQRLAGFTVPAEITLPSMKHSAAQPPVAHTWPAPQLVRAPRSGCARAPAPSHAPGVKPLPSWGHDTPLDLFTMAHPPRPSHEALCWQLVGAQAY